MSCAGLLRLLPIILLLALPLEAAELIVGINYAGNPPLTFAQKYGTKGIYREVLEQIGALSGHQFKYVYLPPKRLLYAFEKGEVDIEPGINPSWRATSKLPGIYTEPFATSDNIVLFAKGKQKQVHLPTDLLRQHVGVIRGYYYPGYMELFASGKIIRVDGNSEYNLLNRMASGRLDQIFIQKDVAYYYMSQELRFAEFEVGDINFRDPIMFRVHPSKRHIIASFNQAIARLNTDGKIKAIYAKYH